ncbi:MAG: type II secretion system protein [Candidatus Aminicenantes bacterium]|nr:type II secretion system protein [Candidatus Aminicenantes bacterium]
MSGRMIKGKQGFTLVEMLVTLTILAILATAIMPLAKIAVKREKEIELRRNLRLLREAIDAYKKMADEKKIEIEEDSEGYPPDLETLVNGVEIQGEASAPSPGSRPAPKKTREEPKIIKFLRRIPKDPMTDSTDWGLRSYQDDPDDDVWGGENVYDVYTKSLGTALDGSKYRDW